MHLPRGITRRQRVANGLILSLGASCALATRTAPDRDPARERGSTVIVATGAETGLLPTYTTLDYIPFSPLVFWGDGIDRHPALCTTIASLLDRAAVTVNPDTLDALYVEMWPSFQADLPATFLHPLVSTTIAHRRVRGLGGSFNVDPLECAEELWIEENR